MMKRKVKILVLMMLSTIVFMCACGGKNKTNINEREEKNSGALVSEVVESEKEDFSTETSENSILQGTYKVPLKELYIDVPSMHQIDVGYTEVFNEKGKKYVAFTCLKNVSVEDEKGALDVTFEEFKLNMSGLDTINHMGEITEEYLTINGIDVYSFEGVMNCGDAAIYDAYVKGYSFIFEDMPCSIIGVVKDREQPQEQIDAIKEIVDAMILTVRNEQ